MTPRLRAWASTTGARAKPAAEHARALAEAARTAVHKVGSDKDSVLCPPLEAALLEAFEAGYREGRQEAETALESSVRAHVERAVREIRIEGGKCPDCMAGGTWSGQPCDRCGGLGRFRSRM